MPSVASHALPYVLYVAIGAAAGWLPAHLAPWTEPLRVVATALALVHFARRGAYGELAVRATPARAATLLAILAGVAGALLWLPLGRLGPLLGSRGGFDLGSPLLLFRVVGYVAVIPFAEELFVRSLVPRFVDAREPDQDWRARPVGAFTPLSFAVSVGFFTLTHPEWLAALVVGLLWTGLLANTRRLRDVVLAHVVANALVAGYVLTTGDTSWW